MKRLLSAIRNWWFHMGLEWHNIEYKTMSTTVIGSVLIENEDRHIATGHWGSEYEQAGIPLYKTHYVSTVYMSGSHRLHLRGTVKEPGMHQGFKIYRTIGGHEFHFCVDGLEEVFDEVPSVIYYISKEEVGRG